MSVLHLIWIIPMSVGLGFWLSDLFRSNKD